LTGAALRKGMSPEELEEIAVPSELDDRMRPAQTMRLERLLESDRQVPWDTWRERHLEHPAIGEIARQLIWECADSERARAAGERSQ
jgi:hypothetical protein